MHSNNRQAARYRHIHTSANIHTDDPQIIPMNTQRHTHRGSTDCKKESWELEPTLPQIHPRNLRNPNNQESLEQEPRASAQKTPWKDFKVSGSYPFKKGLWGEGGGGSVLELSFACKMLRSIPKTTTQSFAPLDLQQSPTPRQEIHLIHFLTK